MTSSLRCLRPSSDPSARRAVPPEVEQIAHNLVLAVGALRAAEINSEVPDEEVDHLADDMIAVERRLHLAMRAAGLSAVVADGHLFVRLAGCKAGDLCRCLDAGVLVSLDDQVAGLSFGRVEGGWPR